MVLPLREDTQKNKCIFSGQTINRGTGDKNPSTSKILTIFFLNIIHKGLGGRGYLDLNHGRTTKKDSYNLCVYI